MGSQLDRFTIPFFIMSTLMSFKDQKRFERYTNLGSPRFSGIIGEDAYEFYGFL